MTVSDLLCGGILLSEEAPFALDEKTVQKLTEKWDAANYDGEVNELIETARGIASPKAYLRRAEVAAVTDEGAELVSGDGHFRLTGSLITEKLCEGMTVVGTLCTCGTELHALAVSQDDPLLRGVADDICLAYMRHASIALHEYVRENVYGSDKFSVLSPGSLGSWDISHQSELFAFLGEGAVKAGVELTPSFLMIPYKSGSGLCFPTENKFESCMRCPRENCPNRRASYEKA